MAIPCGVRCSGAPVSVPPVCGKNLRVLDAKKEARPPFWLRLRLEMRGTGFLRYDNVANVLEIFLTTIHCNAKN